MQSRRKSLRQCCRWCVQIIASLAAVLGCALAGHAQIAGTASVQGTVTDVSGAVVANATITIVNASTRVQQQTKSDGSGVYAFPNIPAGEYRLTASSSGFKTYVQPNVVLEVGSNISINPVLQVGDAQQSVEVQAEGLALQTEDTSYKQTVDQKDMVEMPLNGRQMTNLIFISGGSSPAPGGDFTGSKYSYQTIAVSVAGGMGNTTEWKLDGADNNDYMSNANLPFPFPDAVQEFSVESIDLGERGGEHSGGLVNVITKSGTSQYHGDAFEFIRNNYLDATNFFSGSTDTLHQNQFGGTIGGPIIPHRDKLFGFAGYQRTDSVYSTSVNTMYIPTPANLQGDFSVTDPGTYNSATGLCSNQLYDPYTGQPIIDTATTPYTCNKYANPPAFNASAVALMKYMPTANSPEVANYNVNTGEVQFAIPGAVYDNQFVSRVDYNINPQHNLYGRYMIDGYQYPAYFYPNNILVTFQAPGQYQRVQSAVIGEAWSISPHLVNNVHAMGTKRVDHRRSAAGGPNATSLNITDYQAYSAFLQISASTPGANHTWSTYCGTCSPGYFNLDDEGISDDLTWIKGRHQLVIGGEFLRIHFNENVGYQADGDFTFNGEFSGSGPTGQINGKTVYGDSNLDFLWGAMSAFSQSKEQQLALRGNAPSLYIQDTFNAGPRLTIVGGIRWSPEYMPVDYFNRGSTFDYASFLANIHSSVYPNAPAGSFFYGDPGVTRQFTHNTPWQFDPNIGASWQPFGNGNTVIRGGMEVAYDLANYYTTNRVHQNPPFATDVSPSQVAPLCFSEPWLAGGTGYGCAMVGGTNTSPYPQPEIPPPTIGFPAQGQFIVLPATFRVSDTLQWTVSVQRQFPRGWQAQLDYIGNRTRNMPIGTAINQAVYTPGTWGPNATGCGPVVTTGAAAAAAGTANPKVGSNCSTTANEQARFVLTEANPSQGNLYQGGGASALINDNAWANYNGMVASLQHRVSSTFSLMTNYTWSRCMNVYDAQGDQGGNGPMNPNNIGLDYGRCGSDYRNIFNTALVATSNFQSLHGLAAYLVNNWELAPLLHITSGAPLNVTDGSDVSLTDIGNDRPNLVPGVSPVHEVKIQGGHVGVSIPTTQANRGYLNPAAFCFTQNNGCAPQEAPGTYGNLQRNLISGPMFFQFDSQISRIWPIAGERWKLDTRLEAFNVLNHPNFANPSSSNPAGGSFGTITSTAGGSSLANIPALSARLFQGSVKIIF
jgi:hypothetical protein